MKSQHHKWFFGVILACSVGGALPLLAQDPNPASPPPSGGWRRFEPNNSPDAAPQADPNQAAPRRRAQPRYQAPPPSSGPVTLTLPAGAWITARVDEPISSDHSQPGD